jgi:RNA polymerase primary sigma factor
MRELIITPSITSRDAGSLEKYFNDIKKIKLLSAQEEVSLCQKIKQGDRLALEHLVSTNLRFVVSVAKKYQHQGVAMGDLINEGNIGLIAAAKRFDETRGFKFISFAVWWIRQAIVSAIAEQSRLVHLPYNFAALMGKYTKAAGKLEQLYGRKPLVEEVADYLEMNAEKIHDLLNFYKHEISLHNTLNADSESTLLDVLPNDDQGIEEALYLDSSRQLLKTALANLKIRERTIIQLYFGLDRPCPVSLEVIAWQLDISVESARRLKDAALLQIRKSRQADLLKDVLIYA